MRNGGKTGARDRLNVIRASGNGSGPTRAHSATSNGHAGLGRRTFVAAKRKFNESLGAEDDKAGFALLKQAAAMSCIEAHEWLGYVYDYGYGTRPNRRLAFKHYMIAAEAGKGNAEYHIGVFYHEGISVCKNYRLAVSWFRRAAEHGDATALHALGKAYRYGWGVRKNLNKGFKLELEAANKGEREAQFSVGVCLSRGEGVAPDPEQAFQWYLRAAKRGHCDAAHNLANFYGTGRGVRMDKRKADFWYARAHPDETRTESDQHRVIAPVTKPAAQTALTRRQKG